MNTPKSASKLRLGLSRNVSSSLKKPFVSVSTQFNSWIIYENKIFQPLTTPYIPSASSNTPQSSTSSLKKTVIKKKKLEFASRKLLEEEKEHERDDDASDNLKNLDIETLKKLVSEKEKELSVLERHQAEKQELIKLTDKWRQAGLDGLKELSQAFDPPKSYAEILHSMKIPKEMFLDGDEYE